MRKRQEAALKQREVMNTAAEYLTDAQASTVATIYPVLQYTGKLVRAGTRIYWGRVLKRAAVDLWDREENNPDNAPDLWENILYRDGFRIIPEVITVGKAFALNELGWWGDVLYKSLVGDNIYTPAQYAPNWEEVSNG